MKKIGFLILGLAAFSEAATVATPVTQVQVQQAQSCSQALVNCSLDFLNYSNNINALFNNGFQVAIYGSTSTVIIPSTLQNQLIDATVYQAKKQACANAYNSCP